MSVKDNEAVYDEEVYPLMAQIAEICKRVGMPMAATFEYAPDSFCTTTLPADGQSKVMGRCIAELYAAGRPASPFQITTTSKDGSKVLEVFIP